MQISKQITKNFNYNEFFISETAQRKGIVNFPSSNLCSDVFGNITRIAFALQFIRDIYAKRIRINSGFRSGALNAAVGGVPDSRHLYGAAVDVPKDAQLKTLLNKVCDEMVIVNYDKGCKEHMFKVIDEGTWLHFQLQPCAMCLSIIDFYNKVSVLPLIFNQE